MTAAHRRAADRIATGSAALLRRLGHWLTTNGPKTACARGFGCTLAAWAAWRILTAAPHLAWPATAAWLIAAWRTGRTAERARDDELAFVQTVRDQIGDARGAHLAAIATALNTDTTTVRDRCTALDIPIRPSIKTGGKVSPGVHLDDLTAVWEVEAAPPPPAPSRAWHTSVTRHNYPTTPEDSPSPEGDVDQAEEVNGT